MREKQMLIIACAEEGLSVSGSAHDLKKRLGDKLASAVVEGMLKKYEKNGDVKTGNDVHEKKKRKPSAYNLYMSQKRKDVAMSIGATNQKDVMIELGKRWKLKKSGHPDPLLICHESVDSLSPVSYQECKDDVFEI